MSSEECRRQVLEKYHKLTDALEKENQQLKDELYGVKKEEYHLEHASLRSESARPDGVSPVVCPEEAAADSNVTKDIIAERDALRRRLNETETQRDTLAQKLIEAETRLEELDKKSESLVMKTDDLRGRAERKEADLAEAEGKVVTLGKDNTILKQDLFHARKQCAEMGKSLDESNALRVQLGKTWEMSEEEVTELQGQLSKRDAEIVSLKEKLQAESSKKVVPKSSAGKRTSRSQNSSAANGPSPSKKLKTDSIIDLSNEE